MKNTYKGVLISGLLYPGLGQITLKKYKRGIVLILVTTICILAFVMSATQMTFTVLEKIQAEGGIIDMETISNAAVQTVAGADSGIMTFSLLLIIVAWIIGIIDAYLIGKKMDNESSYK